MAEPHEPDLTAMIAEVTREIQKRREVYSGMVSRGSMNGREAARRIGNMMAVHRVLLEILADPGVLPHVVREHDLPLMANRR